MANDFLPAKIGVLAMGTIHISQIIEYQPIVAFAFETIIGLMTVIYIAIKLKQKRK